MMDIFSELKNERSYKPAFERLRAKADKHPYLLNSAPLEPNFTLRWALDNEIFLTKQIIQHVSKRLHLEFKSKKVIAKLDKERVIYSQSWLQKILQGTLASIISNLLEPVLSPRLFSYRRGRGESQCIKEFVNLLKANLNVPMFIFRADIQNYDSNIDREKLIKKFKDCFGQQDDYVWSLLDEFLKPKIIDYPEGIKGLPMGFHLTPISENLYLDELDKSLDSIPGLFYTRYGDDIILASTNSCLLNESARTASLIVSKLGLNFHPQKTFATYFSLAKPTPKPISCDDRFKPVKYIKYLGVNIYHNGEVFLSDNKLSRFSKEVKNCIRIAYAINRKQNSSKEEILASIISSVNCLLKPGMSAPHLDLLLALPVNKPLLAKLDAWIARQVIRCFHRGNHNKLFRYIPYSDLRKAGLVSLLHRKYKHKSGLVYGAD